MKTRFAEATLSQLAKIADFDAELRRRILKSVAKLPLKLYPFEGVDGEVKRCLVEAKIDEADADDLGGAVASFLYVVGSSTQAPNDLLRAAAVKLSESHDQNTVELVVQFLSELLDSSARLVAAKATALYEDSERILLDSRLLVDIRPIFDPKHVTTIVATTLLYKLRMTFRSPRGGDIDTMVLTLREPELKELAAAVRRAMDKAEVVREAKPFSVVLVESENDDR